jgi:hypothetical protein
VVVAFSSQQLQLEHQRAVIEQTGFPPGDPSESAVVADLPPGAWTAVVVGKDGANGVASNEVSISGSERPADSVTDQRGAGVGG